VKYRINISRDEDGAYVVTCPAFSGCVSEGKTRKEALSNIRDAIEGYIASLKKHGDTIPPPIEEELVEVSA
jgi:predicted RNase H-like HicB family nuclease